MIGFYISVLVLVGILLAYTHKRGRVFYPLRRLFYPTLIVFLGCFLRCSTVFPNSFSGLYSVGYMGSAYSFSGPLYLSQRGYSDIRVDAHYETKPFMDYPYWGIRFEYWRLTSAWEFELIHHKVYLQSPPDTISYFNMSDGYNFLLLNRSYASLQDYVWRFGMGVVMAHPESRIRGQLFSESGGIQNIGFYLAGPVVQVGLERRYLWTKSRFLSFESKLTLSQFNVPINEVIEIIKKD